MYFIRILFFARVLNSNLYFSLRALFSGIRANQANPNHPLQLRRNIHLTEKAVAASRSPRRCDIRWAQQASTAIEHGAGDEATRSWGAGVLSAFWERQGRVPEPIATATPTLIPSSPYKARYRPALSVTAEAFHRLAERRRSIRCFTEQRIPLEILVAAMRTALLSPSACNRQAFRFRYYDEPETVRGICESASGVRGATFPAIIVISAVFSGYENAREIWCPMIDAMQTAMTFQYALETHGLSSLCINWPTDRVADAKIRKVISIPPDESVIMRMAVGYPDPEGLVASSGKRPVHEVLSFNQ